MTPTVLVAAVFVTLALGQLLQARVHPTRAAHTFARKVDLALPATSEPAIARRLAVRERAGSSAALAGVVLLATWVLLTRPGWTPLAPLAVAVIALGAHSLGQGAVAWWESSRAPRGGTRIARTTTPVHGDYVARHERWGGWVLAALAAVVAAVVALAPAGGLDVGRAPWPLLVTTAVLPSLAMAGYELAAARLLERPQVATTTLDLAWDDALRAHTLRDMLGAVLVVGLGLPLVLLSRVGEQLEGGWPANPAVGLVSGAVAVLLGGSLLAGAVSLALRPHRHFRARLWPRAERGVRA